MGNCCGGDDPGPSTYGRKQQAFQGEGHRLGSADETRAQQTPLVNHHTDESLPEPIHNPNLTEADREKQRADRLAAVEGRMKGKQPKKPKKTSEPLRGPNSKNTMQWNV